MTNQQKEQTEFEQQLRQAYQHSKARHTLPAALRKSILQAHASKPPRSYQRWLRHTQLALGSIFLAVLGYLLLQPINIPAYHIVVSYNDSAIETENHRLTVRSVPALMASFAVDENQQRYQQMLQAQHNFSQFHAEQGVLQKKQQYWQITLCNAQVVTLEDNLLQQLLSQALVQQQTTLAQSIQLYRGTEGQILAIKPLTSMQQCPMS